MSIYHTFATIGAVAAAGYLLLCGAMFLAQKKLVYFPTRSHVAEPAQAGLAHEDVWLPSRGEETVHGWWVPAGENNSGLAVVFCHGNGGNISHRLDTLRILHGLGLSVCLFDYQGYGKSTGSASEKNTYADAAAAWRCVTREKGYSPDQVVVWGRSLGGAIAAHLAWEQSKAGAPPAGLILESTFTSVPDMGARLYPFLPVRLLSRFRYNTLEYAAQADCPVLVAHSPEDDIVPYSQGRALYEALDQPKQFLQLQGDHNAGFLISETTYVEGVNDFLQRLEQ